MGPWSDRISALLRRDYRELALSPYACTKNRSCEHTVRRWPSASQKKSPHQNPTMPRLLPQTSHLQICEEINFYCLNKQTNKKHNIKGENVHFLSDVGSKIVS